MKKHIDDVQTLTVDEHLKLLLEDKSEIEPKFTKITPNNLPYWYDKKLFKEGQNCYKRNMLGGIIANLVGLVAIISVPETLKVLVYTNKSSRPCAAFSRYMQTILHTYKLYTSDANDPDSDWYKTINVIHWKHKMSSKKSKKAGVGGIYQRDMAFTQFAFVGYIFIIASKSIGLRNITEEEQEALNHFWRVTGYMLEIPDRLNICRKTIIETRELCQKLGKNVLANYLNEAPSEFFHIISVILDALWYVDITLNKDAFLAFVYRLHGIEYKKPLGWYSKLNIKYRDFILYLCDVPYIGEVVRVYYNYMLRFTLWFMQRWPVHVWLSLGKKNTQITLYSIFK